MTAPIVRPTDRKPHTPLTLTTMATFMCNADLMTCTSQRVPGQLWQRLNNHPTEGTHQ